MLMLMWLYHMAERFNRACGYHVQVCRSAANPRLQLYLLWDKDNECIVLKENEMLK